MKTLNTKYGVLKGITNEEYYENLSLKECMLSKHNQLKTKYGHFVPTYGEPTVRTKYGRAVAFYSDGTIKSINLEQQTEIITSVGRIPAELITFYESGALHRVFLLNGKLTGYWSEEEEFSLAKSLVIPLPYFNIKAKIVSINFYESQSVKSITFWKQEEVSVPTSGGEVLTNVGFSLYETGELKSIEPKKPVLIKTPIGEIKAHDVNAIGIHADDNSLEYYKDGSVKSLTTTMNQVIVVDSKGEQHVFSPRLVQSFINESEYELETIKLYFDHNVVKIKSATKKEEEFVIDQCLFLIERAKF